MKFLHCADVHLGCPNGAEREQTFLRMLDFCARENVELLLIAGDLFDAPTADAALLRRVSDAFAHQQRLIVLIAAGNHDPLTPGGVYDRRWPDNVYIFGPEWSCVEVPSAGVRVWGMSFSGITAPPFTPPETKKIGTPQLGVLHGTLGSGEVRALSRNALERVALNYLALGHIHSRSLPRRAGHTVYAYSGCLQGQGFDETGEKGAYLGELSPDGGLQLSFVRLCGSITEELEADVSDCGSFEALAARCAQMLYGRRNNRVRLTLTGESDSPDCAALERLLWERTAGLRVEDRTTRREYDTAYEKENTVRGEFSRRLLKKIAEAQKNGQDTTLLRQALQLGLKAFEGEVTDDVD